MPRDAHALSDDPNDFCCFDTETRSPYDVTVYGAYRHTAACRVVILTYAIGPDAPTQCWAVDDFGPRGELDWADAPADLRAFYDRALAGKAWFVAWNAAFDRLACLRGLHPPSAAAPALRIDMLIDAMAQGAKSHLPPDLAGAAQFAGSPVKKQAAGKALIRLFAPADSLATPLTHPVDWQAYKSYAVDDTAALRHIFFGTAPLDRTEWQEYWANEYINDRGIPIDERFAERASVLASLNTSLANDAVRAISMEDIGTVTQHARIMDWVLTQLGHSAAAVKILTREVTLETDDAGNDTQVVEMSLSRDRVEELLLHIERLRSERALTDAETRAQQMLEVRLYGASATPGKYAKMVQAAEGGCVKGQYVFNGAPATGRYSSRGVQTHNLTRATVGTRADEIAAINMISEHMDTRALYDALKAQFGPVGRTLSRLIRPAFLAPEGQTFCWSDWSAIEARGLPWLAASPGAETVLDTFRANDADPRLPDIYEKQAAGILGVPANLITEAQRQSHGKVPVLSLGFGGATGALFNMARQYGASFTDSEASGIVASWRANNLWARDFWDALWTAALCALDTPGSVFPAGRVAYVYDQQYLRGTLICMLPDGRALFYPRIKWGAREEKNKHTGVVETKTRLMYQRGRGRAALWYGLLAENNTQAICGSLLRWAILECETQRPGLLVGHTHDELLAQCATRDADETAAWLAGVMSRGPDWAAGFPLHAVAETNDWYTKTKRAA